MTNKIEQQMLDLIEQIEHLDEADEFPNGSLSIIGSGKKPKKKIKKESAPKGKGWEKTVKGMKKHPEIDNPFALAHWMKKKGYKPRKEAADPSGDGKVTPDELRARIDVKQAQQKTARPGSKMAMNLPGQISKLEKQYQKKVNPPPPKPKKPRKNPTSV